MEKLQRHNYIDTVDQVISDAAQRQLVHLTTSDQEHNGKYVTFDHQRLVNFGSCSYLGLETEPRIINAIVDAAQRFGSQFSSSRAYVSCSSYQELEALLSQLYQKPVLVTASTTLGHLSALPVLIDDQDAVILDHQVHASVQMAAQLLKPRGVTVNLIRHNRLDMLEDQINSLKAKHKKVWYLIDGVYSMFGDAAPLHELYQLLEQYPQLHLYVDDAHGMSWIGDKGVGFTRHHIQHHERMMLVTSLNKAFASAGGLLVFPNAEWARRVRTCGSTLIFSGPIQPPMLGAAIASAKLHLQGELQARQQTLMHNIQFTNQLINRLELPLLTQADTPIFFIGAGMPKVVYNLVNRLMRDGFYTNSAAFPAVPMRNGGVRFTVTYQHNQDDISALLHCVREHYEPALREEGSSITTLYRHFKLSPPSLPVTVLPSQLKVQFCEDIQAINPDDWDKILGHKGSFDWHGLQFLQNTFSQQEDELQRWKFYYMLVRDPHTAQIILASFFTVAWCKDDMFADRSVSAQVEQMRRDDPRYLTSKILMLGSMLSEGEHLYLDKQHPKWPEALDCLLQKMEVISDEQDTNAIMLRDFLSEDAQLEEHLLRQGFIRYQLPQTHRMQGLDWQSQEEYLAWLPHKARWHVRREIFDYQDKFHVQHSTSLTASELAQAYQLYSYVQQRGLDINSFKLPLSVFEAMNADPRWDILRLSITTAEGEEKLAAAVFSYLGQKSYIPMLIGLDYRLIESHKVYKQALYQVVHSAKQQGFDAISMGFTAHTEKKKVGAQAINTHCYIQAKEHFSADIIENMVVKR